MAPNCTTAVKAVTCGSSIFRSSSFSATVRCAVLETGRNSVRPSTTPRIPLWK
jgi:hypothetical protein